MKDLLDILSSPGKIDTLFLFFIPGFISILVAGLIGPTQDDDFSKKIVTAIGYSALNFAGLSLALNACQFLDLSSWSYFVKGTFIFVLPVVYPFVILRLRERQAFGFSTPFPSTWDQFFARRSLKYFVRAKIKDEDRYVLGYYGRESLASLAPAEQMLLLEKVYDTDEKGNWIERKDTVGILLPMAECESVEFIIPGEQ